jgi:hypothetical protein
VNDNAGPRLPDPRMIPPWQVKPVPARPRTQGRQIDQHGEEQASVAGSADAALADATLVRPFLVTGGRTRPLQDGLRIETLVYARPAALSAPLRFELRRIVELCQTPLAVAEVAVRLGVPLGVARVLVADLLSGGYVTCEQPAEIPIDVIERIRDRVRAL